MRNGGIQLRISDLLFAVQKRWKVIVALTFIGAVFGLLLSGMSYVQSSLATYDISGSMVINTQREDGSYLYGDRAPSQNDYHLAEDMVDIRFTGKLPREEAVARMEEADVFVMLSRPETYGLVYLEAMARGCVTVASRGEGFDGLIDDGENGFLAEPESVEAAVAVLERVHALTAEQRRAMIQRGYDLARSMTEDQTAQKFLEDNTCHKQAAGGLWI